MQTSHVPLTLTATLALAMGWAGLGCQVAKLIEIILGEGGAAGGEPPDPAAVPAQAAALEAIARLEQPPRQLSSLVNRVLLSAEGMAHQLWEPCARALRYGRGGGSTAPLPLLGAHRGGDC